MTSSVGFEVFTETANKMKAKAKLISSALRTNAWASHAQFCSGVQTCGTVRSVQSTAPFAADWARLRIP
jgi:hypothetical protein